MFSIHPPKPLVHKESGFSIIELLIVILITGILAAIAVPVYLSTIENKRRDQLIDFLVDPQANLESSLVPINSSSEVPKSVSDWNLPFDVMEMLKENKVSGMRVEQNGSQVSFCRETTSYTVDFSELKVYALLDSSVCNAEQIKLYIATGENPPDLEQETAVLEKYGIEHIAGTRVVIDIANETITRCLGSKKEVIHLSTMWIDVEEESSYCTELR